MKFFYLTFGLLFTFVACKSVSTTEKPEAQPKEKNAQLEKKDYDPYFAEGNQNIKTTYGPTNITRNIIQDSKGHFWLASWDGIYEFDGKYFTNHTNKDQLRRFRAFSVLEDKDGIIWFGTIGAGLYRYDGEFFENITTKQGLVNNDVTCIFQDKTGLLWFGTQIGISLYDGTSFTNYTSADGLCNDDVNSFAEDSSGKIWIGTRGTACTFDGSQFEVIKRENQNTFNNTRSIITDDQGKLWLGGQSGLWSYDGKAFKMHSKNFVGYLYQESSGNILSSESDLDFSYGMSLIRYTVLPQPSKETSSSKIVDGYGQVFGIIEDKGGDIWFGLEKGIGRYNGTDFEYFRN